jgi:hypothetical protein
MATRVAERTEAWGGGATWGRPRPAWTTRFAGPAPGLLIEARGAPSMTGLDDGAGAGTLDAVAREGAPEAPGVFTGFDAEGEVGWRRAVEVFIVFFEGLEAVSFTSTRRALRE